MQRVAQLIPTCWNFLAQIPVLVVGRLLTFTASAEDPPASQLSVVNVGSNEFAFSQTTSQFPRELIIESTNETDVADLSIKVQPFVTMEGSVTVTSTVMHGYEALRPDNPIAVAGLGDVRIVVSATLERPVNTYRH